MGARPRGTGTGDRDSCRRVTGVGRDQVSPSAALPGAHPCTELPRAQRALGMPQVCLSRCDGGPRSLPPRRRLGNKYLSTKIKEPPAQSAAARGGGRPRGPGAAGRSPRCSAPRLSLAAPQGTLSAGLPSQRTPLLHPHLPQLRSPVPKATPRPFPPPPTPLISNHSPLPTHDPSAPSCPSRGSASPLPAQPPPPMGTAAIPARGWSLQGPQGHPLLLRRPSPGQKPEAQRKDGEGSRGGGGFHVPQPLLALVQGRAPPALAAAAPEPLVTAHGSHWYCHGAAVPITGGKRPWEGSVSPTVPSPRPLPCTGLAPSWCRPRRWHPRSWRVVSACGCPSGSSWAPGSGASGCR